MEKLQETKIEYGFPEPIFKNNAERCRCIKNIDDICHFITFSSKKRKIKKLLKCRTPRCELDDGYASRYDDDDNFTSRHKVTKAHKKSFKKENAQKVHPKFRHFIKSEKSQDHNIKKSKSTKKNMVTKSSKRTSKTKDKNESHLPKSVNEKRTKLTHPDDGKAISFLSYKYLN